MPSPFSQLALIDPTLAAQVRAVLFKRGVAPTPHSVEAALAPYLDPPPLLPSGKVDPSAGLDKILSIYADARAQGVLPTKEVVGLVAARLAAIGWGTAALEMAEDFEANAASLGGAAKEAAVLSANAWEALLRGFVKHRQVRSAQCQSSWATLILHYHLPSDILVCLRLGPSRRWPLQPLRWPPS